MALTKEDKIKVLKAWHLVEFFQAYSVPDKEDSEISPVNISYQELMAIKNRLLPWLDLSCRDSLGLHPGKKCTYTLYLGLFDKAVVDQRVTEYFGTEIETPFNDEEIEQRRDNEGLTCFAKLMLDEHGSPRLDTFSVSTLPWALGELSQGRGKDISQSHFDDRCDHLAEFIERWETSLSLHPNIADKKVVSAQSLYELVKALYEWANLRTSDLKLTPDATVNMFQMAFFETNKPVDKQVEDKAKVQHDEIEDIDDEEDEPDHESQLPILNSFYIRDIEKAINAIVTDQECLPLLHYLSLASKKYKDLYTNDAIPLIHQRLSPDETPEGRWLSEPTHNMSLMQQFAINTVFSDLKQGGLLSVNGPPGTGKSTLLRDIIAQNIVERAKGLAKLARVTDGINNDGSLVDSLTGYEMVVASSNNAAVENISKELPQKKSIANCYGDKTYFNPVSNLVCAKERKSRLQPLDDEKLTWGNISCVLGAKKKRENFLNRFFFTCYYPRDKEPTDREPSVDFLNFWQYAKMYDGPSFKKAKSDFKYALSKFKSLNKELSEFNKFRCHFDVGKYDQQLKQLISELKRLQYNNTSKNEEKDKLIRQKEIEQSKQEEIVLSIERLKLSAPNFIHGFFNTRKKKKYDTSLKEKLEKLENVKKATRLLHYDIEDHNRDIVNFERKIEEKTNFINKITKERQNQLSLLATYKEKFKDYHLPEIDDDIHDPNRQRYACWQNEVINKLRSDVFSAALSLHEAWAIEAITNNTFRERLFKINDVILGKSGVDDGLAEWQIFFMIVPVVSTTFASLGRMFSKLDVGTLGWLMIDEAGQAIPQAAVGGLLRAKRAIVVGDPLQIEPVFTSPPALVQYLMELKLGNDANDWSPCLESVQTITDRVNPYGCMLDVDGQDKWIGIPLWVHRRCIEPMFSISNEIAYDRRMIPGPEKHEDMKAQPHSILGCNRWIDSKGNCTFKQYKRELGNEVLNILLELADNNGNLHKVYVISPFKAVKNKLKEDIRSNINTLALKLEWTKKDVNIFLKDNIGTVHTFQGKENDTVILVLGCDPANSGGASWASSKPNLLNVAVSRAKKNLFVVGDSHVWGNKKYFYQMYQKLPINQVNMASTERCFSR